MVLFFKCGRGYAALAWRTTLFIAIITALVFTYLHVTHHVTKMGQIVIDKTTPKPISMDNELLLKYRATEFPGGRTNREGELLKCASEEANRTQVEICLLTIARNWLFDEHASRKHGCKVHSFDPSINTTNYKRSEKIQFYNIGLGKEDRLDFPSPRVKGETWIMLTFKTMLSMLGLSETRINMVKMDIETEEYAALPLMARDGSLRNVEQLALEIHVGGAAGGASGRATQVQMTDMFRDLEEANFALYYTRPNKAAPKLKRRFGGANLSCYEMHFFNKAFIHSLVST